MELSKQHQKENNFSIREHEFFIQNVSPYIDNELDTQECYEFRKYLTKSKTAQKELKKAYVMQKELKNSYNKVQKKATNAISRRVIKSIKLNFQNNSNTYLHNFFNIKIAKVAVLLGIILVGGYEVLHLNNYLKTKPQQNIEENYTKSANDIDKKNNYNFIEF